MFEHPDPDRDPVDVVRAIYGALAESDLDAVLDLTSPDVVVVQDPALPWGGRYVGHRGLSEFFLALVGHVGSQIRHDALFQAGDHVVQHGRTVGTVLATGVPFDLPECHLWRVENGRAVEAHYLVDSAGMLDALAGR